MSLQELFERTSEHPTSILIFFLMLPITAFIAGAMTDEEERYDKPWEYLYSVLIHLACIPGILALTMCAYHLFFDRRSLVDLNVFTYFLPIVAMIGTLFVIKQDVNLDRIPGFDRIPGLLTMIAATFIGILLLQKTRIWVMFNGGSAVNLLIIFVVIFVLFRWGLSRFFQSTPKERKPERTEIW